MNIKNLEQLLGIEQSKPLEDVLGIPDPMKDILQPNLVVDLTEPKSLSTVKEKKPSLMDKIRAFKNRLMNKNETE